MSGHRLSKHAKRFICMQHADWMQEAVHPINGLQSDWRPGVFLCIDAQVYVASVHIKIGSTRPVLNDQGVTLT